jgi:hypothetical protein
VIAIIFSIIFGALMVFASNELFFYGKTSGAAGLEISLLVCGGSLVLLGVWHASGGFREFDGKQSKRKIK